MNNQQLNLWKRYTDEINEHNQPFLDRKREMIEHRLDEEVKQRDKDNEVLKKIRAVREKYSKLSWWKKLFVPRPLTEGDYLMRRYHGSNSVAGKMHDMVLTNIRESNDRMYDLFIKKPTYEDFLDWQLKITIK